MPLGSDTERSSSPELTEKQERESDQRVAVTALVVHEAIRKQGEEELSRPASALAWSGFAAGLTMSFSLIAQGLLRARVPNSPWAGLLVSMGYPLGYLIVIIGRQQLFTENTLTAVIPLLARKDLRTAFLMLRLWIVVLAANLAGAHLAAWTIGNLQIFPRDVERAFADISELAASVTPGVAVLRGILAGWLIATVVWLIASSRDDHFWIIVALIYFVGLGQFTHVIAGSIDVLYRVTTGSYSWVRWLMDYFLPTLAGNVIGGVSLVSLLNHAQVVSGGETNTRR